MGKPGPAPKTGPTRRFLKRHGIKLPRGKTRIPSDYTPGIGMPLPKDSTHLVVDADHRTVVLSDLPKAHRDAIVSALRKVVRRGSELHGVKGKFSAGPDTVMVRFE